MRGMRGRRFLIYIVLQTSASALSYNQAGKQRRYSHVCIDGGMLVQLLG